MANENVKIVIQEVNETMPKGSGTSSDIVYIPGLAIDKWVTKRDDNGVPVEYKHIDDLDDYGNIKIPATIKQGNEVVWNENAPLWEPIKNEPILCNTVAEFERYFGNEPYTMTEDDVTNTRIKNYHAGDYDKSYIYAKELLNAGMSVVYENIASESEIKQVGTVKYENALIAVVDENGNEVYEDGKLKTDTLYPQDTNLVDNGDNTFTYTTQCEHTYDTYMYNFNVALSNSLSSYSGSVNINMDFPSVNGLSLTATNIQIFDGSNTNVIANLGEGKENVTIEQLQQEGKSGFIVDQDTRKISWINYDPDQFKRITISFCICTTYDVKDMIDPSGTQHVIAVSIFESAMGSDISNAAPMSKITYLYKELPNRLNRIEDKSEYSVKYITSGGYPSFVLIPQEDGSQAYTLATAMLDCAGQRGDAVALIDHIDNPELLLGITEEQSIYYKVNQALASANFNEFGAMFTPWGRYTCTTVNNINRMSQLMPASFGYLMCMAKAIKTSPNWLAMAGVTRGLVPNLTQLHTENEILTNVIAEDYQPKYGSELNKVSVNAITNIKPYGLTIWGNRTLEPVAEKGTTALNFLNIRNMVSDIKKLAYSTAKSLMFEQDSDTLWLRFKSGVSPLLEQLKSGYGISDYKIIRGTTKYNGAALTRGELAAVIKIFPLYAIEYFEITVVLADDDVTVS